MAAQADGLGLVPVMALVGWLRGTCMAMYPHFWKKYPQMYPRIPPDSGTLQRTFAH